MKKKKSHRGRKREGSGRKPTGRLKAFKIISISGTPEEVDQIKQLAENAEKSVSKFIIEKVLEK